MLLLNKTEKTCLEFSGDEFQHSKYLLQWLLPHIEQFSQEQIKEKVIEAKIQGIFFPLIWEEMSALFVMQERFLATCGF